MNYNLILVFVLIGFVCISGQQKQHNIEHDSMRIQQMKDGKLNIIITSAYITTNSASSLMDDYDIMSKYPQTYDLPSMAVTNLNDSTISVIVDDYVKFKNFYRSLEWAPFCFLEELELSKYKSNKYDHNLYHCIFEAPLNNSGTRIVGNDGSGNIIFYVITKWNDFRQP